MSETSYFNFLTLSFEHLLPFSYFTNTILQEARVFCIYTFITQDNFIEVNKGAQLCFSYSVHDFLFIGLMPFSNTDMYLFHISTLL